MNLPDYTNCTLCPRMCHVNRSVTTGYCGCSSHISAARAALHKWEEPVLSGPEEEPGGSGAKRNLYTFSAVPATQNVPCKLCFPRTHYYRCLARRT